MSVTSLREKKSTDLFESSKLLFCKLVMVAGAELDVELELVDGGGYDCGVFLGTLCQYPSKLDFLLDIF